MDENPKTRSHKESVTPFRSVHMTAVLFPLVHPCCIMGDLPCYVAVDLAWPTTVPSVVNARTGEVTETLAGHRPTHRLNYGLHAAMLWPPSHVMVPWWTFSIRSPTSLPQFFQRCICDSLLPR